MIVKIFEEREGHIQQKGDGLPLACNSDSLAGAVSQRACVYSGARVVLNPITDALHLVHGPIGCASYTWDIRGAASSGPDLYRNSFSTDMKELDVVFGGEKKLAAALRELAGKYLIRQPSSSTPLVLWVSSETTCSLFAERRAKSWESRSACEVGRIQRKQERGLQSSLQRP